jgi:alkylhydroperoxidase/carboxymuconolactone decarboxylase family protein YurZ
VADLKKRMKQGLEKRRQVFGEGDEGEWTDRNNSFDPEFQEYMLGFRWGTITARPGLDLRTRQLCAVATFLSLGLPQDW